MLLHHVVLARAHRVVVIGFSVETSLDASKTLFLGLRPFNPPRGVLGPFGPKVGNGVENEFPGPSGPGGPKS